MVTIDMDEEDNFCDDCGKRLEDCEWWQGVEKAREEIKKEGNSHIWTLEEYIGCLQREEEEKEEKEQ